jgi:predicted O-methyltransferase YrrM
MSQDRWTAVDDYLTAELGCSDEALDAALAASDAAGLPAIAVSPPQGKFLNLMARMVGARRILEVGTLGGYSAIWLARALPEGGELVTLEIDATHAQVAEANLARAGLADRAKVIVGPALDTLPTLDGPFDLAFIDADKQSNADYFAQALRMSRPGSVIIVDNVIRKGAVIDQNSDDPAVAGVRRLNALIAAEPRVDATAIQTVGSKGYDGFAVALVTC